MSTIVRTQTELDATLADPDIDDVDIRSEHGVWLTVTDSATVRAGDSATVRAGGSATVEAWGSATVEAGSHTAVHLHSGRARVSGGVLVDHTAVDRSDALTWAGYHGATVTGDEVTVYKAVRDDLRSQRGTLYAVGAEVSCGDFAATDECGGGLHFSPRPAQAAVYDREAVRYLECTVQVADLRTITAGGTPKCKAPRAQVVREVDVHGRPLPGAVSA